MSWNGLDVVVFYESAIGYNIFGQTAVEPQSPCPVSLHLKKNGYFTYKYSRCGRPMKASSLITSKEFDVNNLPRKSTQWKRLNWQIANLCCFYLSEKWVGVVHRKMSRCLPFTVLFIQVIFVAFFNHQLSHQTLSEGVPCAPLLIGMSVTCPG